MEKGLPISHVAHKTGLNPKTIRYYEAIGLIPPPTRRQAGYASKGYRMFTQEDLERLTFIKRAKLLDLSLQQIKEILHVHVVENGYRTAARSYLQALVAAKLHEVSENIEQLHRLRQDLERIAHHLTEAAGAAQADCCEPFCGPSTCGGEGELLTITRAR